MRRSVRGEYQIGGPTLCASAVTVLTLCPLGEPEIAIGHEPRIEPWLPRNRIACQVSRTDRRRHHEKMNRGNGRAIQRRTLEAIESHLQTVGWISRQEFSRIPAKGEVFLLTSLFIELPISKCDIATHRANHSSSETDPLLFQAVAYEHYHFKNFWDQNAGSTVIVTTRGG